MPFDEFKAAIQRLKDIPEGAGKLTDDQATLALALVDAMNGARDESSAASRMAHLNTPGLRITPDKVE